MKIIKSYSIENEIFPETRFYLYNLDQGWSEPKFLDLDYVSKNVQAKGSQLSKMPFFEICFNFEGKEEKPFVFGVPRKKLFEEDRCSSSVGYELESSLNRNFLGVSREYGSRGGLLVLTPSYIYMKKGCYKGSNCDFKDFTEGSVEVVRDFRDKFLPSAEITIEGQGQLIPHTLEDFFGRQEKPQ
jgi:hypothetical protein